MTADTIISQTPMDDEDVDTMSNTMIMQNHMARLAVGDNPQDPDAKNATKPAPACSMPSRCSIIGLVSLVACAALAVYCYFDYDALHTTGRTDKSYFLFLWDSILDMLSWAALTFCLYSAAGVSVPVAFVFLRRRMRNHCGKTFEQRVAEGMPTPDITVLIPCFLPNEQDIIEDTINWVMEKVKSPAGMKTIVVYNTPKDMPEVEARLQELATKSDWKDDRELQVLRVWTSKSKSENLNYVLPKISTEYFVIYDADHNPDPDSLMRLWQDMWEQKADIAQGSTYIRNLDFGCMARFIDAEFFVLYFCIFPATQLWTRVAVFGGSNALICKASLEGKEFSHTMQTEDIDLSIRMQLSGKKIIFSPEARSGELVPPSFKAYYKQRLRWAIGWDQVSFRYADQILTSNVSCFKKYALIQWLHIRWGSPIANLMLTILNFAWISLKTDPYFKMMCSILVALNFSTPVFGLVEAICQAGHRGCETVKQIFWVILYFCAGILVSLWTGSLIAISWHRIFTGNASGWVVTVRSSPNLQSLKSTASSAWLGQKNGSKTDLIDPLLGA